MNEPSIGLFTASKLAISTKEFGKLSTVFNDYATMYMKLETVRPSVCVTGFGGHIVGLRT